VILLPGHDLVEKALIDFLVRTKRGDSFHDIMKSLGDPVFDKAVELAVSYGYVEGLQIGRVASGHLTVDTVSGAFRLTPDGDAYLSGKSL
jgi:hypothetical protein